MADSSAQSPVDTAPERIRELVDVRVQPTVVRLADVEGPRPEWLAEAFVLTPELAEHVRSLETALAREAGCGVFVIGQYGAGKSHLLAWLALRLERGAIARQVRRTVRVSLVDYAAEHSLESILAAAAGVDTGEADRRAAWDRLDRDLVLLVDELSEFLRSKADPAAFTEDVRFLQFLGEWVRDKPVWLICALQEGIEHTGELDYALYRKIKDRFPLRLLLSPAHITRLIADGILVKHPGYDAAVAGVCRRLAETLPGAPVDLATLAEIYPMHPATLALLEEVRDRFSQTRGVVDFLAARLAGRGERAGTALLDRPWGELLTPEVIVDHFRDLFELAPEFQALSQQLLPWYERHMDELFDKPRLAELAWRVLKLLILVQLSPARERLSVDDTVAWLLVGVSRTAPERNRRIVERVLATLAERGRFVAGDESGYWLSLARDERAALDRALARELGALAEQQPAVVLASLADALPRARFNPLALGLEQWHHRRASWHFHERRYAVFVGDTAPGPVDVELALCLRLPWGEPAPVPGCYTLIPGAIEIGDDLRELAALARLSRQPLEAELGRRVAERVQARSERFERALIEAYGQSAMVTPEGKREPVAQPERGQALEAWLEAQALRALRRTYPGFERYAPTHGPLPREAWTGLMREAAAADITQPEPGDWLKLVREAYWVPMGLLRRKAREYVLPANLARHELVQAVTSLAEQRPGPSAVHEHLAQPIHGLVPDQVDCLLVFLLLQGEIDLLKGRGSYREQYETLPRPRQYDQVVPGRALSADQLKALERLASVFELALPRQWTVLAQRRAVEALRQQVRGHTQALERLAARVEAEEVDLAERLRAHCRRWAALDKGGDTLEGLRQLLYEADSAAALADETRALAGLPAQCERLISERRRLVHLIDQLDARAGPLAQLDAPPGLADPDALERWLGQAREAYAAYCEDYAGRHKRYWSGLAEHPAYAWRPPEVARARQLGLQSRLAALTEAREQARRLRCGGLSSLEFQVRCQCGFDGEQAPVASALDRFAAERRAIEEALRCFFRQDQVVERLRQREAEGVELDPATRAFLADQVSYPAEAPPQAMDEYLGGEPLVRELDAGQLLAGLDERPRSPDELARTLAERLQSEGGAPVRLRLASGRDGPDDDPGTLLAWCAEALARSGLALPESLSQAAREAIGQALRPEAIGEDTVRRLDALGLTAETVERVLGWLHDGTVALPASVLNNRGAGLAGAVAELQQPRAPAQADELASLACNLYRAHPRVWPVAGPGWLEHLDAVAHTSLTLPASLGEQLKAHRDAQWLLVDCLGLALLPRLTPVLEAALRAWRCTGRGTASVAVPTDTDQAYRSLVEADLRHGFAKIDGIDALVHAADADFGALERRAAGELELALGQQRDRLDAGQALVVFADHGFRLNRDGRGYGHGGDSTLERLVPVWRFESRG